MSIATMILPSSTGSKKIAAPPGLRILAHCWSVTS